MPFAYADHIRVSPDADEDIVVWCAQCGMDEVLLPPPARGRVDMTVPGTGSNRSEGPMAGSLISHGGSELEPVRGTVL